MGIGTSQFRLPITLDTPLKFHVIIEPFLISGWHLPLSQCFSILSSAGSGSRCTTSVSSLGKLPSSFGEKSPEMTMRRNQQIRRITPIGFVTFCRVIMMILALSPFMKSLFWHSSSFSSFSGSSGSQNSWRDGENYFQLSKIFKVKALLSFLKICHSQSNSSTSPSFQHANVSIIKFCWWLHQNHKPLVLEVTALPIEPIPFGFGTIGLKKYICGEYKPWFCVYNLKKILW